MQVWGGQYRDVGLLKVEPRGLFESVPPHIGPQDGDADELLADEVSLLYKHPTVQRDLVEHR